MRGLSHWSLGQNCHQTGWWCSPASSPWMEWVLEVVAQEGLSSTACKWTYGHGTNSNTQKTRDRNQVSRVKTIAHSYYVQRGSEQKHMAIRENNHTLPKSFASLITLQSWAGFPSAEEKRNIINMHKIGHANIFRVCATFWNNKMGNCILLFFF